MNEEQFKQVMEKLDDISTQSFVHYLITIGLIIFTFALLTFTK